MYDPLELSLAQQCGPVLLGRKPAALFSMQRSSPALQAAAYLLRDAGLALKTVPCGRERQCILAYHPQLLAQTVAHPVVSRLLAKMGYPQGGGLGPVLAHLQRRMRQADGYPHEIGLFLGYPPADVVGFMFYGGQHFKHICTWKVYGNVEMAKALHSQFELCRDLCRLHIEHGGSLRSLHLVTDKAG